MKDEAIKRKLNINIYDYNDKYKRCDVIDTWIDDKASNEYHNALIYADKTNIHIMYIQFKTTLKVFAHQIKKH